VAVTGGRGREGLGGAGLVLGALKEKGRRREEARGREAVGGRRGREVGRRLEVEDGPDRYAPPVSGAGSEREIAGRLGEVGRLLGRAE
jgi:hypothetical protein